MKIGILLWNTKNYGCNTKIYEYTKIFRTHGHTVSLYRIYSGNRLNTVRWQVRSFLHLFKSDVDVLVLTGYWLVAYIAILLPVRNKIYYVQGYDPFLSKNVLIRTCAKLSYLLPYPKIVPSQKLQHLLGAAGENTSVIAHGVITSFKWVKRRFAKGTPIILCVVSSYADIKGGKKLVEVLQEIKGRIPSLRAILVSFEPKTLSPLFDEFYSNISAEKLSHLYARSTLLLNASFFESFYLPGLEAMSYGCPVVLSDCGGVAQYAKNGVNSLLFPSQENVKKIATKIIELLKNPSRLSSFSHRGLETSKKFSIDKITLQFEEYFQKFASPVHAKIR